MKQYLITILICLLSLSDFFSLSKEQVTKFLKQMIEAKECWHTNFGGFHSGFPKNLIIPEQTQNNPCITYTPSDFKFSELDDKTRRMWSAPLSIVWMPNNNCYTACEYCYADRKHHDCIFSPGRIESFVRDAVKSGVVEIMLTGGDFFENPHWKEILTILQRAGYNIDMISTKKPLFRREIETVKAFGIRLQISLDTISGTVANGLLHVAPDYATRMKTTLQTIDEEGLDFQVATVLTSLNDDIESLDNLSYFLSSLKNIRHWEIRVAFRSLYSKADFDKIKSTREQIDKVANSRRNRNYL